jgi:protein disulfide-isomerase
MKIFIFCLVVLSIGSSVLAYRHNPAACTKLATDIRADLPTIQADLIAISKPTAASDASDTPGDDALPQSTNAAPSARLEPTFTTTTSYDGALAEARRTGRKVMLHFTGSDWSPFCKSFDEEVLASPNYSGFAAQNFITVTLDFPKQAPADDNLRQQNVNLAQKYHVDGYPTLVLIDTGEHELVRISGYVPGSGPQGVLEQLEPFAN